MKRRLPLILIFVVALLGVCAFVFRGHDSKHEVEYHYSKVERGDVSQSIQATGQLVALTSVDVKSKAGGIVVYLAVDEGTIVKKGQLIARIDPADTKAVYDQAAADYTSAEARVNQTQQAYKLQVDQSHTDIRSAETDLATARIRLRRAELQTGRQPELSNLSVANAQAAYDEAYVALQKLDQVTLPQTRRDAMGAVTQTKSALATATSQRARDEKLLAKGYIAQADYDRDATAEEQAKQIYETAKQRASTLDAELQTTRRAQVATVARLKSALDEAKAQLTDKDIADENLREARKAVDTARVNLQKALDARRNEAVRQADIKSAVAATKHSQVAVDNAKVQLDSTTVVAPRDGVVTLKYLEEGTIIPPGTSTFAQGTSLVQLSDVHQMFVDCTVDEADIAAVQINQKVKVTTEAYKDKPVWAVVTRVSPAAVTLNNVTTVKVRVKLEADAPKKIRLVPGMNATCEFITMSRTNVLKVPSQAIQTEGDQTFVLVKGADPKKPEKRLVKVGKSGNDDVEILEGLKEGEEVVTAQIDVEEAKRIQQALLDAQQGTSGLAGGNRQSRSFGTTSKK
ncbi:MAG TPA: efflux RND transporter periplasmic adaptor subunit [Fimbriimonadaceae bacterium]|nr:efflux RND transporter periplasmic adaptor subunit [Fimbriimonadaceae bacterium]